MAVLNKNLIKLTKDEIQGQRTLTKQSKLRDTAGENEEKLRQIGSNLQILLDKNHLGEIYHSK